MDSAADEQPGRPGKAAPVVGDRPDPTAAANVLRRWIATRHGTRAPSGGAAPAEFGIERAATTALGRAAERQARLPVFVEGVELARMTLAELPEFLPEHALLAVIEGRRDAIGVVAVCPNLLTSLIEMQAIGRVTSRTAPIRKPTRTDASISADFINALLGELARECQGRHMPDFGAFRYATYTDAPRPLLLMLEEGDMIRLGLRFRIGPGGQRDGRLVIALPLDQETRPAPQGMKPGTSLPGATAPAAPPPAPEAPRILLAKMAEQAPITLVGILCRRKISLQMLRSLTPGALIPLPPNALDDALLETAQGQPLARGRLGEAEGYHAMRLRGLAHETMPPRPATPAWPVEALAPGDIPAATRAGFASDHEPPMQDQQDGDAFRSPLGDTATPPIRSTG
jgi:flagellar motor switch protein FliM